MEPGAAQLVRARARTGLKVVAWDGAQHAAVEVVTELVNQAVQHGDAAGEVTVALTVDEHEVLVIEVSGPSSDFPAVDEADAPGETEPSLAGKTVQVRLRLPPQADRTAIAWPCFFPAPDVHPHP